MKTSGIILALATIASAPVLIGGTHGDPYRPVGSIDIDKKFVRSASKPQISWDITYPVSIPDLLLVAPSGTVTTKEDVIMKVRVAGVAFQSGSTELPVAVWSNVGGSSWSQLFYGTGSQVKPNDYVVEKIIPANTTIDFAGRARSADGQWHDVRWTQVSDLAVAALSNGDEVPEYAPQGEVESFLTGLVGKSNNGHGNNLDGYDVSNPGDSTGVGGTDYDASADTTAEGFDSNYIDDEAKTIATIGPRDMVYLFELASRDPAASGFDMQDLAIVVTYEPVSN